MRDLLERLSRPEKHPERHCTDDKDQKRSYESCRDLRAEGKNELFAHVAGNLLLPAFHYLREPKKYHSTIPISAAAAINTAISFMSRLITQPL